MLNILPFTFRFYTRLIFFANGRVISFVYTVMKIWKVLIAFALPYFIIGCCNCITPIINTYSHCSVQVDNIDNSGAKIVISQSDTIAKRAYGIRTTIALTEGFCKAPVSVFSSAYALRCGCEPEFQHMPNDSLVSFTIITENDFDASHLAGDTINDYFYIYKNESYYPFEEYKNLLGGPITNMGKNIEENIELDMLLMTAPANSSNQSFIVELLFADNRKFTTATKPVFLL